MALVMEPICAEGRIAGDQIIRDLCNRIKEKLERGNDLRSVDSYASYAAKVTIELQLTDVDTVGVVADLVVGQLAQQAPPPVAAPQPIELVVPPVVASIVAARIGAEAMYSNLERSVDGSPIEPHAFVQPNLERPIVPEGAEDGGMIQAGKRYTPRHK